jgi:hypothetical protein
MGIYDEMKDTFVSISQEGNILYKNFSEAFKDTKKSKKD